MKLSLSIIVGLLAVIAFLFWRLTRVQDKLNRTDSVLSEKSDSIRYWKSRSGKTVASKTAAEISKSDLKEHYQDIASDLADMKIKLSGVRAVLKAVVEANGSGQVRIVRDTIRLTGGAVIAADSLFVRDSYLDFRAALAFDENAGYRYTYSDSILFTLSTERKWFLGRKKLIGKVRMSNPNSRSTGQTSILIREKPKRWTISAGVSYDPSGNRFVPAVHAGYSLMKF